MCLVALVACGERSSDDAGTGGTGGGGGGGGSGGTGGPGGTGGTGGTDMLPFDCDQPQPTNCPENPPLTIDTERPAEVEVPEGYTTSLRYPLVVTLHARDVAPVDSSLYLGAPQRVDVEQFVLIVPSGTVDTQGRLAWATAAGDSIFEPEAPDDVAYLLRLIEEAQATYRVDEDRVYVLGSSNGASLALDVVCEDPLSVTAILAHAGALPIDEPCSEGAVSALSVHGTVDEVVPFGGGTLDNEVTIQAAVNLIAGFAERGGCGPIQLPGNLDLVDVPPGAETRVRLYQDCEDHAETALWAVQEAGHVPDFTDKARDLWFEWILTRTRSD